MPNELRRRKAGERRGVSPTCIRKTRRPYGSTLAKAKLLRRAQRQCKKDIPF